MTSGNEGTSGGAGGASKYIGSISWISMLQVVRLALLAKIQISRRSHWPKSGFARFLVTDDEPAGLLDRLINKSARPTEYNGHQISGAEAAEHVRTRHTLSYMLDTISSMAILRCSMQNSRDRQARERKSRRKVRGFIPS